ncbi:unnamed protein product [Schistosoma mattheei]|uniref:Uncharacterized protein n=1 Tax=Schistosoma mattheei TaxID=31246 RepID=A0A183PFH4_9TREM|nr:unnamed protein product [Schistosoma mattheei]
MVNQREQSRTKKVRKSLRFENRGTGGENNLKNS